MTVAANETFSADAVAAHLKQFIVDALFIDMEPAEITDDMLLGTDVGVDSLGFAELLAHLEDEYGISVTDGEFVPDNFATVGRIVALVGRKLAG
ncbi:acyl carrier protein [Streptomyces sp. XM83C]|jgi:acyl carrier protein|uniref:Acyl carrier protein n=1 Tax=Streptomyces thermocoprophilus TaxID=78356 RepID=A0ABV5VGC4_9ACTN|nr:acyl carrier protein [Streptomyces sp. XM83C]MCK1821560.1 acyl carrier protein [Streptomyces sp. XM83C]